MTDALAAVTLIALREAFEASLIMAIIFAVLTRLRRENLKKYAWYGAGASVLGGIILGLSILLAYGVFPEKELFEAGTSYLAAVVITSVIVWMARHGAHLKEEIESRFSKIITPGGVIVASVIIVGREVLETVLFASVFLIRDLPGTIGGVILGTALALALAFAIYRAGLKLNLRYFFVGTSILLVFVASGIAGYGTSELLEWAEETGINTGFLGKKAYVINIPPGHPLNNDGIVGGLLSVLLGYSTSMEWGRILVQFPFLTGGLLFVLRSYRII